MNLQERTLPRYTLWLLLFVLLGGILFSTAMPVAAQDGAEAVTDDEVNDVAKEIYCPVCESTPLDVCATQACSDWRELIRTKLGEGETKEDIFDYFARQYGDSVLANPPRRGFNLVLWFAPVVAIGIGFLFFGRFMRNLRGGETETAVSAPTPPVTPPKASTDNYVDQVEAELKEL